jgi:aminoglycoside 2''-phosphotransferase
MRYERGAVHTDDLLRRIRTEFPRLSFSRARLIEAGDDHAVLVLDRKWVFRFPRNAVYRKAFAEELRLLAALQGRTTVRIPVYSYLSRAGDFGGYRLIPGREMTTGRFARLSAAQKNKAIGMLARFLATLHRLDPHVLPARRAREPWSGDALPQYQHRYRKARRQVIARFAPRDALKQIDGFYDPFVQACGNVPSRRVIHGDISDEHILLDGERGAISGVIDFGDAAVGDPAYDLCFFWAYGDAVARALYAQYGLHDDPRLFGRSRWHYGRYMIDRLFYALRENDGRDAAAALKALRRHLPELLSE